MELEDFAKILKILEKFNFDNLENVPETLKCVKCKKILKSACQVLCGCQFCLQCIEKMMNDGLENCIGFSKDCKSARLSTYFPDNRTNKEILKMSLKCPMKNCAIECQLIDMMDHLRLCPKRATQCIFYDFGCNSSQVEHETFQEHYLNEQENHNRIILETIGSLKNELNEREKRIKTEMEIFKKDLEGKEEKINIMFQWFEKKDKEVQSKNEETISMMKETENLKGSQIDFERGVRFDIDRISNSIISINEKLKALQDKFDSNEISQKVLCLDTRIMKCESIISENMATLENTIKDNQSKMVCRLEALEKNPVCIIGNFDWQINQVRNNEKDTWIYSPSFFGRDGQIEMQLAFCNRGKYFDIGFGVYYDEEEDEEEQEQEQEQEEEEEEEEKQEEEQEGEEKQEGEDEDIDDDDNSYTVYSGWPFKARINIKIMDVDQISKIWENITKKCLIEKPTQSGFNYLTELFRFWYKDNPRPLEDAKIDLIVRCSVIEDDN